MVVVVDVLVVMVVVVVVVVVIVVVAVVSVVMMIETVFSIVVAVAFWNCVELTSTLAVVAVDSLKFTEVAVGLPVLMLLCFNSVVDLYIWKLKSREEFNDDERASDCDVAICCVAWATNDDSKLVAVGVVRSMVLVYVNAGSVSDEENPGELEIYVVVSVDGWIPSVMLLKCIVLVVVWKWKLIGNVELFDDDEIIDVNKFGYNEDKFVTISVVVLMVVVKLLEWVSDGNFVVVWIWKLIFSDEEILCVLGVVNVMLLDGWPATVVLVVAIKLLDFLTVVAVVTIWKFTDNEIGCLLVVFSDEFNAGWVALLDFFTVALVVSKILLELFNLIVVTGVVVNIWKLTDNRLLDTVTLGVVVVVVVVVVVELVTEGIVDLVAISIVGMGTKLLDFSKASDDKNSELEELKANFNLSEDRRTELEELKAKFNLSEERKTELEELASIFNLQWHLLPPANTV